MDKRPLPNKEQLTIPRRKFLHTGAALVGATTAGVLSINTLFGGEEDKITIGMLTDVHYADRDMKINRYYRESAAKVKQCVEKLNALGPDFIIELGDFVDKGETVAAELSYLDRIDREYAKFRGDRHYVIGNHDVATFSKEQLISNCGAQKNYYSFDKRDFHFIILDACYNKDESDYNAGNFHWTETYIPTAERKWLEADLQKTKKRTVVFVHQRLDDEDGPHGVKNAPEARAILEQSGKVLAVFQGHDHRGAHKTINGIHYCTLQALVEGSGPKNNAFSFVQIQSNGSINIRGFGKQRSYELTSTHELK